MISISICKCEYGGIFKIFYFSKHSVIFVFYLLNICYGAGPDNRPPIFWPQNNQEPGPHPQQQRQQQNQISRPVPRQVFVIQQRPMQHYAPPPAQPQYATPLARLQNINTPQIMHPLNRAAGISRPSGLLNNNAYMIVTAQSSRSSPSSRLLKNHQQPPIIPTRTPVPPQMPKQEIALPRALEIPSQQRKITSHQPKPQIPGVESIKRDPSMQLRQSAYLAVSQPITQHTITSQPQKEKYLAVSQPITQHTQQPQPQKEKSHPNCTNNMGDSEQLMAVTALTDKNSKPFLYQDNEWDQYIKRDHVYKYLRAFLHFFPPPFVSMNMQTVLLKMDSKNRAEFLRMNGGDSWLPSSNKLLKFFKEEFRTLDGKQWLTPEAHSALVAWMLFRLTGDILGAMRNGNPWQYCACKHCEEIEQMLKRTLTNNYETNLRAVYENCRKMNAALLQMIKDPEHQQWLGQKMIQIKDATSNIVNSIR